MRQTKWLIAPENQICTPEETHKRPLYGNVGLARLSNIDLGAFTRAIFFAALLSLSAAFGITSIGEAAPAHSETRFHWRTMLPYFSGPQHKTLRQALRRRRCTQAAKHLASISLRHHIDKLVLGHCYLQRKRPKQAYKLFMQVPLRRHLLRDYVAFWRGTAAERAREPKAAIRAYRKVRSNSLLYREARLRAAALLQKQGQIKQALRTLQPTQWAKDAPKVWWLGLQLLRKQKGKKAQRLRTLLARRLWTQTPSSDEAKQLARWLQRGYIRFRPTLQDRLRRVDSFNQIYDYRQALRALRKARLPRHPSKALRCRFYYAKGYAWFRRRIYSRAIRYLKRAKAECHGHKRLDVRSLYWLGKAYRRRGLDRQAEKILRLLARRFPGSFLADDALFLIADRHDRRGRKAQAQRTYQEMMRRFPHGDMVRVARWRLSYQLYHKGKLRKAIQRFRTLLRYNGRSRFAPRAWYYLARAIEKRAWRQPKAKRRKLLRQAEQTYLTLVRRHPVHYYSFLALKRLQRRTYKRWKLWRVPIASLLTAKARTKLPKHPPPLPKKQRRWRRWLPWGPLPNRPPTDRELLQMFHNARAPYLQHVAYRRGRMLYRLGLHQAAAAEWLSLRRCKILAPHKKKRRICGRRQDHGAELLALHFHLAKQYYLANWTYRARGIPAGKMPLHVHTLRSWYLAYPKPFQEFVKPAVAADKIDEGMAYAIMREESAFRPETRSWANAYGLMQFIISTARSTARTLWPHRKIQPEDLYDPKLCIRLGVRHLLQLARIFRRQYPLMAAAYNAGPGWVRRWLRRFGRLPFDEWNEAITIKQTRHYVIRVMQTFAIYRLLYHPQDKRWDPAPFAPHKRPVLLLKRRKHRKHRKHRKRGE